MAGVKARADDEGILVDTRETASYDVLFDGEPIWSFTAKPRGARGEPHLVRWPDAMRPWLDGTAVLTLRPAGEEAEEDSEDRAREPHAGQGDGGGAGQARGRTDQVLELARRFGSGEGGISFVDKRGMPVVIDKWGIVQRPFSTRGEEVTHEMAARTREVIEALHDDLGLDAWMAFGTLLGAAREGKAIGHDSDVDLLYLSEHSSPAQINLECYRIKRVLTGRGMKAVVKGGSFVTVLFEASDGAPVGIDVYACFYLDGLLHETATVREPVPREAILPLTTMSFEGHELPAPADPGVLLEASYGPRWQVPDPSFRHQPGPAIINRFDGWFGSMMTNRRAWEMWWHHHQAHGEPSQLAQRLMADLPPRANVVDVGAGNGSDALAMARAEHRVLGLEYARHSFRTAVRASKDEQLDLVFGIMNLFDLRDVLTQAAVDRRRPRAAAMADGAQRPGRPAPARHRPLLPLRAHGAARSWSRLPRARGGREHPARALRRLRRRAAALRGAGRRRAPPSRGRRRHGGAGRADGVVRGRRGRSAPDPVAPRRGVVVVTERVYLHVGAPKSGTTYLQRVLRHNQPALAAHGVLVAGRTHTELVHAGFVIREDKRLANLPPRAARAWERVVADVAAFEGRAAIISYELLAGARARQAAAAVADLEATGAEVHVVVTCRDLGRAVSSAWQERLKFALTTPLEQWQPRPASDGPRAEWGWRTMDPADVARRWGRTLPPERVHIVTAPRRGGPPTALWDRFSQACSIGDVRLDLDVPLANESLGASAAEVLRRVNSQDLGPVSGAREQSKWLRDTLAHAVLADLDGEPITITDAQLAQARKKAEAAVAAIGEAGWQVHGDLGDLEATRQDGRLPGEVPAEELLDVATRAIVSLLLELRAKTLEQRPEPSSDAADETGQDRSRTRDAAPGEDRGPLRSLVTAVRGDDVHERLDELAERLDVVHADLQEGRRLHERVGALSDLVTELLLPPQHQDRKMMRRALREYRRTSL